VVDLRGSRDSERKIVTDLGMQYVALVLRKNSIDVLIWWKCRDLGICFRAPAVPAFSSKAHWRCQKISSQAESPYAILTPMSRFLPNAARILDSFLNLVTDLVADGLRFFRLMLCSRAALSAEILFLRKQLAFYEERQVRPRRLNDSPVSRSLSGLACSIGRMPW
jgi:hypothetical protein